MIDRHILRARLVTKFENIGLHEIVNECFMNALPFGKENTKPYERQLYDYSKSILKSVGGYKTLTHAMESVTDPMGLSLLKKIDGICHSMAMEAADRVVADSDLKEGNLSDIVDNAAFTQQEIDRFIDKADSVDTDDVAQIVKDKTIAVIKDEQEAYDKDEELQEALREEAAKITGDDGLSDPGGDEDDDSDDGDGDFNDDDLPEGDTDGDKIGDGSDLDDPSDQAVESYLDIILDNKTAPRKYTSLFQKMQDICLEAMLNTSEEYSEIPFGALTDVTTKGAMEAFGCVDCDTSAYRNDATILSAMESLSRFGGSSQEKSREELAACANNATSAAVIMYTAMETLNTLYLVQPSQKAIQEMCSHKSMVSEIKKQETGKILAGMESCISDLNRTIRLATNVNTVKTCKERLASYRTAIESLEESVPVSGDAQKLIQAADDCQTVADNREAILTEEKPPVTLPYYMQIEKDANVAEFNRVDSNYVTPNPDISEVVVKMPPTSGNLKIDDDNATGQIALELILKKQDKTPVTESFIQINRRKEYGQTLEQVIQEAVKSSKIPSFMVTIQK